MKPVLFSKAFFFGSEWVFRTTATSIRTDKPLPLHTHDFAEVFWVEKGHGIHVINGQEQPLTLGTLVTMRPSDCHTIRAMSGTKGLRVTTVSIACEMLDSLRARYFQNTNNYFWASTPLPFSVQLNADQLEWLTAWKQILSYQWGCRFMIERFLLELLTERRLDSLPISNAPPWLQKAVMDVHNPKHFVGGTRAFARLAGRSPVHVNRALQKHFGLTTTEIVNRARMEYAAEELANSPKKIIDVGLECGFQNLGHFYKIFRQYHGATPHQYRKRQCETASSFS